MTTSSDRRTLRPRQIFIKTLHRLVPDEAAVMLVIAGTVGIVGGFGAIVFRWLVQFFQTFAIGAFLPVGG